MSKVIIVSSEVAKNVAERLHNYFNSIEVQPLTVSLVQNEQNELAINVMHTDGDIMVMNITNAELYP